MQRGGGRLLVIVGVVLGVLALGATAASASASASSVVGQWRFDEGAGQTAIDDGGFGLDGRLGTTVGADASDPARVPGLAGGALRFGGRTFVRLPNAAELAPARLTTEAVVRGDGTPGAFRYLVAHGAQSCIAGSYGLYTGEHGGIAFYIFDGDHYQVSAAAAPADVWDGGWHHVAGVFDGATVRLYVDGRPVGAPQPAPLTISYNLMSNDSYFGTYEGTCSQPLRGDVDLVRIWNGPLAPDYVGTLSDASLTAPTGTAPPEAVPGADATQSDGSAPASRPTLTPIAPGRAISAAGMGAGPAAPPPVKTAAGVPARACAVTTATKRLRVARRTVVTVRVLLRGQPLRGARITATDTRTHRLATARTTISGRAHLTLKPSRRGRITLTVTGRTDCGTAALTVLRAKPRR